MRPLEFQEVKEPGLWTARYLVQEPPVTENNWDVLSGDWAGLDRTPFEAFGVNNNNAEEIAVYLGLVWRLLEGRAVHAIPSYYRDDAARALHQEPRLVAWEYEVEAGALDWKERDRGFVPARACVPIRPEPTATQLAHRAQAGLFEVRAFHDLVNLWLAVAGDASGEMTFFAVSDLEALFASLTGRKRPLVEDVLLGPDDVFVDLAIGVDLDYYDSLIVRSTTRLAELFELVGDYEARIRTYEQNLHLDTSVAAHLEALSRLSGVAD